VHEEVHSQAKRQRQQQWQKSDQMGAVLGDEIIAANQKEPDQDDIGAPRRPVPVMVRIGVAQSYDPALLQQGIS
jgi:hypothetical protein